jgi:hypothetical protein
VPVSRAQKWWKRGWVWGVIVSGTVGLTVGLGVGLSAKTRDPTPSMGVVSF